jgi:hypothetical protein
VKIIEGAGKYLFGNVLAVNYRKEFISFYSRETNDCEILDEKVTRLYQLYQLCLWVSQGTRSGIGA